MPLRRMRSGVVFVQDFDGVAVYRTDDIPMNNSASPPTLHVRVHYSAAQELSVTRIQKSKPRAV